MASSRVINNKPLPARIGYSFSGFIDGVVSGFKGIGYLAYQAGRRVHLFGREEFVDSWVESAATGRVVAGVALYGKDGELTQALTVGVDILVAQTQDPYRFMRALGRFGFGTYSAIKLGTLGLVAAPAAATGDVFQAIDNAIEVPKVIQSIIIGK